MASHWTAEHLARAQELYAQHKTYTAVARIMGCDRKTVTNHLLGLRGIRPVRQAQSALRIPAEVLADRETRAELSHRDLSAAFFGDPLPGYSALERR